MYLLLYFKFNNNFNGLVTNDKIMTVRQTPSVSLRNNNLDLHIYAVVISSLYFNIKSDIIMSYCAIAAEMTKRALYRQPLRGVCVCVFVFVCL